MRKLTTILTLVAFYQCKPTKVRPPKKGDWFLASRTVDILTNPSEK